MATSETKRDLLLYLEKITREINPAKLDMFTTIRIADGISISRNLASQYLNELVRDGQVIKVNSRPVTFFHKRGIERYLQVELDSCEYGSMKDVLASAGIHEQLDYERAIGFDLSLSSCVAQLKSAIQYPPHGLPVLLTGEPGTGRSLLARLTFEYGKNKGVLPRGARFYSVDCMRYTDNESAFGRELFGAQDVTGIFEQAAGGVVLLENFDRLSRLLQDSVMSFIHQQDQAGWQDSRDLQPHLMMSSLTPVPNTSSADIAGFLPVVVSVPPLRDRSIEEHSELVMHFLRAEGRRIASNVAITRGALRTLVESDFDNNIEGLKTCITNCCAGAYLERANERLVIQTYNLPVSILGLSLVHENDDKLVSCEKRQAPSGESSRAKHLFQEIVDSYARQSLGELTFEEFRNAATASMHSFQDYLNFDNPLDTSRVASYERSLNRVFETINSSYGIELTRKSSRMLAQLLCQQLWGDSVFDRWEKEHAPELEEIIASITQGSRSAPVIVDRIEGDVRDSLGHGFDQITRVLLLLDVWEASEVAHARDAIGIIVCHGYSTATSIADAANRMLHAKAFEALDMRYEQQLKDIIVPLSRLVSRYAFCSSVILLVDTGSLAEVHRALTDVTNADIYVINNVSTGLALEVGSSIVSGHDIAASCETCLEPCAPRLQMVQGARGNDAILFCSENGPAAVETIRALVEASLPCQTSVRLVVADFQDLLLNGKNSADFRRYNVRAIIGTIDPGIEGVPFVGLEDILCEGAPGTLDAVFSNELGPDGMAAFHERVVKNLTLQNVIESITILNPEKLYAEARNAVSELEELSGEQVDPHVVIGLYVHLCALTERLVTKTPISSYPDERRFATEHADFVGWFRQSFRELSQRYKVTVPLGEIAYVYDFINGRFAFRQREVLSGNAGVLFDE